MKYSSIGVKLRGIKHKTYIIMADDIKIIFSMVGVNKVIPPSKKY